MNAARQDAYTSTNSQDEEELEGKTLQKAKLKFMTSAIYLITWLLIGQFKRRTGQP
jgi:hypothetical protein